MATYLRAWDSLGISLCKAYELCLIIGNLYIWLCQLEDSLLI